jgi:hypothetical protein
MQTDHVAGVPQQGDSFTTSDSAEVDGLIKILATIVRRILDNDGAKRSAGAKSAAPAS